jgi:hypothetical protein
MSFIFELELYTRPRQKLPDKSKRKSDTYQDTTKVSRSRALRTVTFILRVMGRSHDSHFQNYHHGLNRGCWSMILACRTLPGLLVSVFAPQGVMVLGLDDTIERDGVVGR